MPTTTISQSRYYPNGARYVSYAVNHNWECSPRVGGKLTLRANPWSLSVFSASHTITYGDSGFVVYPRIQATTNDPLIDRARAVSLSDLRGELARRVKDKNSGALGVSMATSGQAIAMMKSSSDDLTKIFASVERFYQTTKGKRRLKRLRKLISRGAEPTAGMVLAGFFGWAPLLQDFGSAARTLANPWPPASHFSVKRKWDTGPVLWTLKDGFYTYVEKWSATGHSSYSCMVEVSNPNLWLANKLGLINLPGIAWDLVPWSFLVNMVSNMGQVMGSLTDFAGLTIHDTSLTKSLFFSSVSNVTYTDPRPGWNASAQGSETRKIRSREVGLPPPAVTPYVRFPSWGVGTAAISGSLLIQQTGRIGKLISFFR